MSWTLHTPAMHVWRWNDPPTGEVWLYPVKKGWAVSRRGPAETLNVHRSPAAAVKDAVHPAISYAKTKLGQHRDALAQAKSARDSQARSQALRWIQFWGGRLHELREAIQFNPARQGKDA